MSTEKLHKYNWRAQLPFFGSNSSEKGFFTESWGEEQLGGASADAQSYWQGRFAACTFVGGFLGIGQTRNSWGVAPNPTRDAVP